jgi:uncharacterized membrane protein YgcG
MNPKGRKPIILVAIVAVAVAFWLAVWLRRGPEATPSSSSSGVGSAKVRAAASPPPAAARLTPSPIPATAERLQGFRYLSRSGAVAVLDDPVDAQSHFVREGDLVLGAHVLRVAADEVVLAASGAAVHLPYSPAKIGEIRKPYDARAEKLPTVFAPGVDPAAAARQEKAPPRKRDEDGSAGGRGDGSGGGRGDGSGGGRGDGSGGGRGRRGGGN